ncbi:MAG: thioredoxin domain-containing protein [Tissierellia bacterium]|nr:thioredoxin domain-containing protein [Tissierellia bacterium]
MSQKDKEFKEKKKPTLSELLIEAGEAARKPMTVAHNRLIEEKSPYLLHHAFQPIDWYPWGEEAFETARRENKPIFLSIGYSTCHWCHVMAKESFEDHMIAQELNRNFISIKVDMEERPGVDRIYMKIAQVMIGQGGWPLNLFLTPDGKPFYAATYIPKRTSGGRAGLMTILPQLAEMWENEKEKIGDSADKLYKFMGDNLFVNKEGTEYDDELFKIAFQEYEESFDKEFGGFGEAPKFPAPQNMVFLMAYDHYYPGNGETMVNKTLESMYKGGVYDHIGGGFFRYSTDRQWMVPHFEKTLYDNALLIYTYSHAYHRYKNPLFLEIAKSTADYLLRELQNKDGGFYSGQDADVDGVEGGFYLLHPNEIDNLLNEDSNIFKERYGVTEEGQYNGGSIPHIANESGSLTPDNQMKELLEKVYEYRKARHFLFVDDKVLTGWNGLAMSAMAKLYQVSGEEKYLLAAQKTHRFILRHLKTENGRLAVRYRNKHVLEGGTLEDYAYYAWGLFTMYHVTFKAEYLVEFRKITDMAIEHFFDRENGGFFLTSSDGEQLLFRAKETADGALPSGNSVLSWLLYKLATLTNILEYHELAEIQAKFLATEVKQFPMSHGFALRALMTNYYPSKELLCATRDFEDLQELKDFMMRRAHPSMTVLVKTEANAETLAKVAPYVEAYPIFSRGAKHFYYLCEQRRCHDGVSDIADVERLYALGK